MNHELKIETQYFTAVKCGVKKFELRKNDRGFKVGDTITLKEVTDGVYTGIELDPKEIIYICHGGKYGLEKGYCILNW